MKHTSVLSSLLLLLFALSLALVPTALASNTWYVDGVHGNDKNNCKSPQTACKTIRHAISLASSGDSILIAPATYTENLTIGSNLTLIGSSPQTTIVDGGQINSTVTISTSGARVTLSNLTIRNGKAECGGGIFNNGILMVNNSTVSGNSSIGKGFRGAEGGGILNFGKLTMNRSTVNGNTAMGSAGGAGGGIFNAGPAIINNSTLSGNSTAGGGGGILSGGYAGKLSLSNVTISGNSAGFGSGVDFAYGSATTENSVFSMNSGGNCSGTLASKGYNLSSDNTCNFNGTGDLNNTDAKLGKLGNYGGPTQTIPLLSGSPAIDTGNPSGCADGQGDLLKTDQRGYPRPDKEDTSGCDMGAFERQSD